MTKDEKITFVNDLCLRMALDIATSIDEDRVPEEWDGHELRALIAYKASSNADRTVIRKSPKSRRAQDYKNHCRITPNL